MAENHDEKSQVIEVRPCSLVGAATYLRTEYIRDGRMTEDQSLLLRNPDSGEYDIARPLTDDERIRRRLEKARTKEAQKRIARS